MTLRDEQPIHKCSVRGCPVVGRWPEGGACPLHRADGTDRPTGRAPSLAEMWETDPPSAEGR